MVMKPNRPKPKFLSNYIDATYAVGNRVYNGSSPSPHAGKGGVNPAGYQTRENMANVKRQQLMNMIKNRSF